MFEDITVTVIVPIYNVERFLSVTIESIIYQTHENLEIILVNDGSKDNSGLIADSYYEKDDRIKVIHKKNTGVSDTRNIGLDHSTGIYVTFVDADDVLAKDYIEYLLRLSVKNNAEISLTTSFFTSFNLKQRKRLSVKKLTSEDAAEYILLYKMGIGVWCKLFSKDFLDKNNIRFISELAIGEGFNFNMAAFQRANEIVAGNKKIYTYRKDNSESATARFSEEKWINGLYAIDRIKEDLILSTDRLKKAWNFAYWRTHSDVFDLIILASGSKQYSEMYKKSLKITRKFAYISLIVPTTLKQRLRAIVMGIFPHIIPFLMILRRNIYSAKIKQVK